MIKNEMQHIDETRKKWMTEKRVTVTVSLPESTVRWIDKYVASPRGRATSRAALVGVIVWNAEENGAFPFNEEWSI
jgi:hypothetical protein